MLNLISFVTGGAVGFKLSDILHPIQEEAFIEQGRNEIIEETAKVMVENLTQSNPLTALQQEFDKLRAFETTHDEEPVTQELLQQEAELLDALLVDVFSEAQCLPFPNVNNLQVGFVTDKDFQATTGQKSGAYLGPVSQGEGIVGIFFSQTQGEFHNSAESLVRYRYPLGRALVESHQLPVNMSYRGQTIEMQGFWTVVTKDGEAPQSHFKKLNQVVAAYLAKSMPPHPEDAKNDQSWKESLMHDTAISENTLKRFEMLMTNLLNTTSTTFNTLAHSYFRSSPEAFFSFIDTAYLGKLQSGDGKRMFELLEVENFTEFDILLDKIISQ
ncbi:MAG: hypothetical protein C5B59_18295 [Bacteroidetes bacterium]|nr:MAG: hypothetical protein C5B59_18295 [Bacteroidota bacterium]